MSKTVIVETQRQPTGVGVTQSLDASITITRVEIVVVPNMDVVRKGTLIGCAVKLGNGSDGISARWNLNRNLALPTMTIGVIGTLHMVFTNLIMTTHVNRTTY